ncbi:MAG: DeoR/GlpR family DNA-binding transcription regulator [Actinomycetota bacterium]|nr:DeoR/GlpR family DNA-binding transcription regulator [Actinomycetota bacterium]
MTLAGNLAGEERLDWLRERLEAEGTVQLRDAATELGVSEMTIRRDLQELEGLGVVRRVRGGAVATGPSPFGERRRQHARAKAKIASKLLPMVPTTGAIALDASSTMLRLASVLDGAQDLTVITNGLETFDALQGKPGVFPILTGGAHDPRTGSLVGPMATRAAAGLYVNAFFLSAAAVTLEDGASEATLDEAQVKQAFADAANKVVLAVDGSKLDQRSLAAGLSWDQVEVMVTDLEPVSQRLKAYQPVVGLH